MYGNYYGYNMYGTNPQYPQTQQGYQQAQQHGNDDRIWVQGEVGAKAYLIAPGATVALWDSERPKIYLKCVGANGMPTMQTLSYTVDNQPVPPVAAATPTVDKSIEDRLVRLEKAFEGLRQEVHSNVHEPDADDTGI